MNCEQAKERLGYYVDDELPCETLDALEAHLAACTSCRAELETLREVASELAAPPTVPVPDSLWTAIEQRLDGCPFSVSSVRNAGVEPSASTAKTAAAPGAEAPRRLKPAARSMRFRGAPLALAAAVVLAVGLGMLNLVWGPRAEAATVDYSVLLDALPLDAQKAFRKFLVLYDAREGSPLSAKHHAPDLNFELPEMLPGGFRIESVHLLRFGELAGVAATYNREGEFVGVVFHRPVHRENFGPHRDYPCVVGRHEGHKVSVGEWKLVHLMDPTTCHCVLSRLNEQTELPGVMAALAPRFPTSGN